MCGGIAKLEPYFNKHDLRRLISCRSVRYNKLNHNTAGHLYPKGSSNLPDL